MGRSRLAEDEGNQKVIPFTCLRCLLDIQVEILSGPV